jgi:hypothetical protein
MTSPRGEDYSRPVGSYVTHRTKRRFDLPQVSKFGVRQTREGLPGRAWHELEERRAIHKANEIRGLLFQRASRPKQRR